MGYVFRPVEILNDVGAGLGLSQNYLEFLRQELDASSLIGWDETKLRAEFESMIREDLQEWWNEWLADEDEEISINEPRPRVYYNACIALGLNT